MRKLAWLFALVLLAPQGALAAAAWLSIGVFENHVSNIDVASIRQEGDKAWLTEFKVFDPLYRGRIRAIATDYEFDCRANSHVYKRVEILGDAGEVLQTMDSPNAPRPPKAGTIGAKLIRIGCGRSPLTGGEALSRTELVRRSVAELSGR